MFGQACRIWIDVLLARGHEIEYIDLGMQNDKPLPDVGYADVNLLVAGIYAFERFTTWGLPKHGKNALWMFDPLTKNPAATVHGHKSVLFDGFVHQMNAVIAMDASIESYLQQHYPRLAVFRIPYLKTEKQIEIPQLETARTSGIVFLGGSTPHRLQAQDRFKKKDVPVEFLWRGVWGAERDDKRRYSRINLSIHADSAHIYFDQFRALDSWAAGTALVAESSDDLAALGVEPGVHIAIAALDDLPDVCAQLVADAPRRQAMATNAQALLRAQFSPERWQKQMLSVLDNLS